jgi:hypothetical protein
MTKNAACYPQSADRHRLGPLNDSVDSSDEDYVESDPQPVKKKRVIAKDVEAGELPDWAVHHWSSRFLPTLYAWANALESPFDDMKASSTAMMDTVKSIFKNVYPLAKNYPIDKSSPLFKLVCRLFFDVLMRQNSR